MFVSMILTMVRACRGDSRRASHHTFVDGNDFYGAPRTGINDSDNSVAHQPPRKSFTRPASGLREMSDDMTAPEPAQKSTF